MLRRGAREVAGVAGLFRRPQRRLVLALAAAAVSIFRNDLPRLISAQLRQ